MPLLFAARLSGSAPMPNECSVCGSSLTGAETAVGVCARCQPMRVQTEAPPPPPAPLPRWDDRETEPRQDFVRGGGPAWEKFRLGLVFLAAAQVLSIVASAILVILVYAAPDLRAATN